MSEAPEGIFNLTEPAILAHPQLFEAKAFIRNGKPQGEPKFGGSVVLSPTGADFPSMKNLCVKLAKAKWPGRDLKTLKFPFSNGDTLADKRKAKSGKDDGAFQRGKVVVSAKSKFQPRLSGFENGKIIDYETDVQKAAAKPKFYMGVEVLAQFNFVPYDEVGTNPAGIAAYLNLVLTTGKGKKLVTGGAPAAEVFKGYAGSASMENPTENIDDDIAF